MFSDRLNVGCLWPLVAALLRKPDLLSDLECVVIVPGNRIAMEVYLPAVCARDEAMIFSWREGRDHSMRRSLMRLDVALHLPDLILQLAPGRTEGMVRQGNIEQNRPRILNSDR